VLYLLPSGVTMVCSRRDNDERFRLKNGNICLGTLIANPPVMRVLVIDDDACVGAAIQMTPVREGCDAVHAPDADAGIRAFDSSRFDLVVVDLFMPGMDGLQIITEFRRRAPMLSILAVSGFRFRDSIDGGQCRCNNAVLPAPIGRGYPRQSKLSASLPVGNRELEQGPSP
jgi:CheY-like chemotaxis protein